VRCLRWFEHRFTRSGYPIAGPSARKYYELPPQKVTDLWPAVEHVASLDPTRRAFVDAVAQKHLELACEPDHPARENICRLGGSHIASILMWSAVLAHGNREDATFEKQAPVTVQYRHTVAHKRLLTPYVHTRRKYQASYTFADFLPFAGLQTWAWADEPPIIHPTPLYPSTTITRGIDTARQGASHNWGLYGAGALGVDGYAHEPDDNNALWLLLARHHMLWRLVCLTDWSTVLIEFGPTRARTTCWTLNRNEPANPQIAPRRVRFDGCAACLHTTLAQPPTLETATEDDPWATGVRQLVYDAGAEPAAFAVSDDSFRFQSQAIKDGTVRFTDGSGAYEVTPDRRLLEPSPGNLRIDTFKLARGSRARRL